MQDLNNEIIEMNLEFDHVRLKNLIREKYGKQEILAKKIGLDRVSLNRRLNNKEGMTRTEIYKISKLLNIKDFEIGLYFFMLMQK